MAEEFQINMLDLLNRKKKKDIQTRMSNFSDKEKPKKILQSKENDIIDSLMNFDIGMENESVNMLNF